MREELPMESQLFFSFQLFTSMASWIPSLWCSPFCFLGLISSSHPLGRSGRMGRRRWGLGKQLPNFSGLVGTTKDNRAAYHTEAHQALGHLLFNKNRDDCFPNILSTWDVTSTIESIHIMTLILQHLTESRYFLFYFLHIILHLFYHRNAILRELK